MKQILIADDMLMFREPIAATLRRSGYDVITAANGREALDALDANNPDLILLDMAMPVMDGFGFLHRLRAMADPPGAPVIVMSALSEKDYLDRAMKLGASAYLLKSRFSLSELLDEINRCLEEPVGSAA